MIVSYAPGQHGWTDLDARQAALSAAGAERVFEEKVSDRKAKALAALGPGDVLLVTRLE